MILSGWIRSAIWRANRRITARGTSAPRYQQGGAGFEDLLFARCMGSFYPADKSLGARAKRSVAQVRSQAGIWEGEDRGKEGARETTNIFFGIGVRFLPELSFISYKARRFAPGQNGSPLFGRWHARSLRRA